jgi:DNA-binding transcriptional ArsR family regulator
MTWAILSVLTYISDSWYLAVTVHAFDVLGDPVRRRILELLADGEMASGAVCAVIQEEFRISQPAVSQHLKVLRENGFATVRPEGARRLYVVDSQPLRDVDAWLDHFRRFWTPHLDALETELARDRRARPPQDPEEEANRRRTP